jgi:hypothetical protein
VDPVGQALLRLASVQGLQLSWDRFEALQPQDGFARTGLACAFGCMQGPCRIDPFGRGAKAGVCGLDRDGMVAANLLRLCRDGALEAGVDEAPAAAAMLRRPQASVTDLLRRALRLAEGVVAKAQDGSGSHAFEVGYGVLAAAPAVGVAGTIAAETAAGLAGTRAVSLGSWALVNGALLPFACTSGEAELALVSRRISALVAGPEADPGLLALARSLGIPLGLEGGGNPPPTAPAVDPGIEADQVGRGVVHFGAKAVAGALKGDRKPIALLGGFDTPHQSLGWLPTEVAPALMGDGCAVAAWGDAALWMAKAGLADPGRESHVVLVGPQAGAVEVVQAAGRGRIKGACFAGLRDSRDVALALGLTLLGVRVLVATPLPVWGSKTVMATLKDMIAASGGSLALVDKPIGADEVRAWLSE